MTQEIDVSLIDYWLIIIVNAQVQLVLYFASFFS